MAFPPEFLREVGERNRIEDVAASYVNLRRRGKNLVGLCPFHNEKTPSFCIYPENNSFFCFGCNKGGDVISFVTVSYTHLDVYKRQPRRQPCAAWRPSPPASFTPPGRTLWWKTAPAPRWRRLWSIS